MAVCVLRYPAIASCLNPLLGRGKGGGAPRQRLALATGFTMVELVVVLILVGVLAVFAVPRFALFRELRDAGFRDEVIATLRYAQKTAIAKRRMVCVLIGSDQLELRYHNDKPPYPADASCPNIAPTLPLLVRCECCTAHENHVLKRCQGSVTLGGVSEVRFWPDGHIECVPVPADSDPCTLTLSGLSSISLYRSTGYIDPSP